MPIPGVLDDSHMTRYVYGGGAADYFTPGTQRTAPVYDTAAAAAAQSSSGLITDLMSADGTATQTTIVGNGAGFYAFQGPIGRTAPLWASDGQGGAIRIDPRADQLFAPLGSGGGSGVTGTDSDPDGAPVLVIG